MSAVVKPAVPLSLCFKFVSSGRAADENTTSYLADSLLSRDLVLVSALCTSECRVARNTHAHTPTAPGQTAENGSTVCLESQLNAADEDKQQQNRSRRPPPDACERATGLD